MGQTWPATFDELLVGFFEARRGLNAGFAPGAAFGVTHTVQRSQHLLTKLGAFLENGVNHILRCVLASRQALIVRFVTEQFVTNEANITQGGLVVRHSDKPLLMKPGMNDRVGLSWRSNSCLKHTFTTKPCQASIICRSSSPAATPRTQRPTAITCAKTV